MITPSFEDFSKKTQDGNLIPVYQEILADTETPVSAFLKIQREAHNAYLLESVEGGEKWARYSFLGTNPAITIKGFGNVVEVTEGNHCQRMTNENPLQILKKILSRYKPVQVDGLPRFSGGAIGYIGYECVRFFEAATAAPVAPATADGPLPLVAEEMPVLLHPSEKEQPPPDFFFLIADTLLIFDNLKCRIKVVSNAFIKDGNLKEAYEKAVAKIEAALRCLEAPLQKSNAPLMSSPVLQEGRGTPELPHSNVTRESFLESVEKAKEYIRAGDIFQVQVSQRFSIPLTCDPFAVYRTLRSINPSPYMYYLRLDGLHVVGTSPEVLVRLEGRQVEVRPIAGTRRRGATQERDLAMEKELLADPKERAEHIMLVDLGRNDIGRVCDYGSVRVDELMVIERYSHVMHLVSNIVGHLRQEEDAYSLFAACFPAGTVTGAPKIRAMQIIHELEPTQRNLYAGAVGYFGFDGNMDTCITIRTIVISNNTATVQAAAGIVADSIPAQEYQETLNKTRGMLLAIEMAQSGTGHSPTGGSERTAPATGAPVAVGVSTVDNREEV